jgi:hypothetical protein
MQWFALAALEKALKGYTILRAHNAAHKPFWTHAG